MFVVFHPMSLRSFVQILKPEFQKNVMEELHEKLGVSAKWQNVEAMQLKCFVVSGFDNLVTQFIGNPL